MMMLKYLDKFRIYLAILKQILGSLKAKLEIKVKFYEKLNFHENFTFETLFRFSLYDKLFKLSSFFGSLLTIGVLADAVLFIEDFISPLVILGFVLIRIRFNLNLFF